MLNLSFGGTGNPVDNPICEAITDAKENGVFTVVSAGNAGTELSDTIPAACPDAITVGAKGKDDGKAVFSNYGKMVDVYAPGTDIYTTARGNGYTTVNGTSFSAPLVAGLVAKELAYNQSIGYDQLVFNITDNYHISSNGNIPSVASGSVSSTGSMDLSGSGSSETTLSGSTAS